MQFINLLEELGTWETRSFVESPVVGILDRVIEEVREVNGLPIVSPNGVLSIIRVASLGGFAGEPFCAGEMMVVLEREEALRLVGKPVQVENQPGRPGKIRKAYSREFARNAGVHVFKMKKHGTGYALVSSSVKELTEFELSRKGLYGVLVPGEDVHWERLKGITSVPVFYGLNLGNGGKSVEVTRQGRLDAFEGNYEQFEHAQKHLAEGRELPKGESEKLISISPVREEVVKNRGQNNVELVHRLEIKSFNPLVEALNEDHNEQLGKLQNLKTEIQDWVHSLEVDPGGLGDPTGVSEAFSKIYLENVGGRFNGDNNEDFVKKVAEVYNSTLRRKNSLMEFGKLEKLDIQNLVMELRISGRVWKQRTMTNPSEEAILILDGVMGSNVLERIYESRDGVGLPKTEYYLEGLLTNPYKMAIFLGLSLTEADRWYVVRESAQKWKELSRNQDEGSLGKLITWREYLKLLNCFLNNPADITLLGNSDIRTAYNVEMQKLLKQGGKPWKSKVVDKRLGNLGLSNTNGSWTALTGIENSELRRVTVDFCVNHGLICEVDDKKILTNQAVQEREIYRVLWEKGNQTTGISEEEIKKGIEEFENMKGFTLEQLQKDGIGLVRYKAAVLSGCAGSGKTTVSEGMTLCIEKGFEKLGKDVEIYYAAPTGKAARRLAEVVGRPVKTLHSLLKIGTGGGVGYLEGSSVSGTYNGDDVSKEDNQGVEKEKEIVFIFDEMAMANINLLFEVVKRLPKNANIYFLGDIKQLKPIGKGIPFKDILGYLPAVELGVSKRSAKGSGINYNCNIINQKSVPGENWGKIEERDDFQLKECADSKIAENVCLEVGRLLSEGWKEEDIQVVTPYTGAVGGSAGAGKRTRPWAAANINPQLQSVLNPRDVLLSKGWGEGSETIFRQGDRVIHVNANCWGYRRYVELEGSRTGNGIGVHEFREVETMGVANGEVGRITGYIKSTDVILHTLPEEDREITPRDDLVDVGEGVYFVTVEYYDPDIEQDVVVFYHAKEKNVGVTEAKGKEFYPGDMENLQLAYALTTHKMQGSQSPVVVIPLSSRDNAEFVNRNMVYTAISRASKKVVMIGSVIGPQSSLEKSRLKFSAEKETLLRVLSL